MPRFSSDSPLKSKVSHFFLIMVTLNKELVLYVPRFSYDSPLKSEVSHLKNLRVFNFQALDPKFVLALEPRVLELEGSSFGIRPYIYGLKECNKETPKNWPYQ